MAEETPNTSDSATQGRRLELLLTSRSISRWSWARAHVDPGPAQPEPGLSHRAGQDRGRGARHPHQWSSGARGEAVVVNDKFGIRISDNRQPIRKPKLPVYAEEDS